MRDAGAQSGQDNQYPTGLQIGLGTRVAATQRVITQGPLQTTENPTDVGIQGEGYFRVTLPDGTTGYTRDGSFKLDSQRRLVTSDGYLLADGITFAENYAFHVCVATPFRGHRQTRESFNGNHF